MAPSDQEGEGTDSAPDPSEVDVDLQQDVEVWPIEDVHPYVNNPKEHPEEQVAKIRSSIKNYGWDQPIVVDGDGEIIKGHGRRLAAQSLGLDEVPVIVRTDLTDAQKKAARIADNRTSEADWDPEALTSEFEELQEADDLPDLQEATAFDEDEVEDYFERMETPDEDEWMDHFEDDKMKPDAGEGDDEDKKHITLLLPESRHEQLMDHLDEYEGGRDESFIKWMDESLGEPEQEDPEGATGDGAAQEMPDEVRDEFQPAEGEQEEAPADAGD